MKEDDQHGRSQGQAPDYRFSLANERTFLAWIRTALALLAGGILLHEFALKIQPRWMMLALSVGLACVAALLGGGAFLRWRGIEIAMRHAHPLPTSWLVPVLASAIAVLSLITAALLLFA